MKKKNIYFSLALIITFCFFLSVLPIRAQHNSLDEIRTRLHELSKQLQLLQEQLRSWMSDTALLDLPQDSEMEIEEEKPAKKTFCYEFKHNLRFGDRGEEVEKLQQALKEEGLYDYDITGRFDEKTFAAVKAFQEKYYEGVLTYWRLRTGTGFVGQTTRAKLNELYYCRPEKETFSSAFETVIKTDKEIYQPDEEINITISAKNISDNEITLNFNTSCQSWYSLGQFSNQEAVCLQVLTEAVIPANEQKDWKWNHSLTEYPLWPGEHIIQGGIVGYQSVSTTIEVVE